MIRLVLALALVAWAAPGLAQTSSSQASASPVLSPVTWERLLNASDEPQNWLMYSGTLDSQRYSGLEQIHNRNVGSHTILEPLPGGPERNPPSRNRWERRTARDGQ